MLLLFENVLVDFSTLSTSIKETKDTIELVGLALQDWIKKSENSLATTMVLRLESEPHNQSYEYSEI